MASRVVYIVDDDLSVRTAVRRLVSVLRHPIHQFGSAEQFLAQVGADTCGCLILDVRLPGMTGLQLQQRLSDERWDLRVIFITAHDDAEVRETALRRGAMDYLYKPFECERLLASVRRALADDDCKVGRP